MPTKQFNQLRHESGAWQKSKMFHKVTITPSLAQELIQLNTRNRPVSNTFLNRYCADMVNGKWKYAGGTVKIDRNGVILDAQKQILAVIQSGTPQVFNIETGFEPEVFDVLDTGQARSAGDVLFMEGIEHNYRVIAEIVKLIYSYRSTAFRTKIQGDKVHTRLSNHETLAYMREHTNAKLLEESATIGSRLYGRARFYNTSTYGAFYYLFADGDYEKAGEFFDLLSQGEGLSRGDKTSAILLLRQKLINTKNGSLQLRTLDKYALLIKAWNAFKSGKVVQQLLWQPKEDFPIIL